MQTPDVAEGARRRQDKFASVEPAFEGALVFGDVCAPAGRVRALPPAERKTGVLDHAELKRAAVQRGGVRRIWTY
jgi:hypothetical protein